MIFGHDTPAGKAFDIVLIISILTSVAVVMIDSVPSYALRYHQQLYAIEWFFTLLFTVEYTLRLISAPQPSRYARSFFGLVDFASILPTYVSLIAPGTQYFQVIRMLRVLRVFRILKLAEYIGEAEILLVALRNSRRKLAVFIATVVVLAVILGTSMYLVEGRTHGFNSIPHAIYWTIVTITTVGYGDIVPATPLGQALASVVMLLGYAIVAVPTGILTLELTRSSRLPDARICPKCALRDHDRDSLYCKRCGAPLVPAPAEPAAQRDPIRDPQAAKIP